MGAGSVRHRLEHEKRFPPHLPPGCKWVRLAKNGFQSDLSDTSTVIGAGSVSPFQPATPVRCPASILNPLRARRNLREIFAMQIEMENRPVAHVYPQVLYGRR